MVNSVQSIQVGTTPALNKIGFAAEKEAVPPKVSLETPKDQFVKKESHAVRNGAIAGSVIGLISCGRSLIKAGGFAQLAKLHSVSKTRLGAAMAVLIVAGGVIGEFIGSAVKHFTKKD